MNYDFDTSIDRTGSQKWSKWPGTIPMWIADMDFLPAPPIRDALHERVAMGNFGYEDPDPPVASASAIVNQLKAAISHWLWRRYDWQVEHHHIILLPGSVHGLNLACRAFRHKEGDGVILLTPVYPPFFRAIANNGMVELPVLLVRDDPDGHVHYAIDFDALKKAVQTAHPPRMLMVCHPHNPIGQVFSAQDRERLGQFCVEHDLILCSDEIHCDLTLDGAKHQPNAMLSEEISRRTVTFMSPTKTFNLSGVGLGFAVVKDDQRRKQLCEAGKDIVPPINALSATAALAAYSGQCDEWLRQLLSYLKKNRDEMVNVIRTRLPGIRASKPSATYLSWLDCQSIRAGVSPFQFFLEKAQVALTDGDEFGGDGKHFLRFNFGCPQRQMREALDRMADTLGYPQMLLPPVVGK